VQLWCEYIDRLVHTHHFHPEGTILLLDGIPRNRHQAEMMDQYIEVLMVLYLEAADEQQMIARLRRRALHENRLDDANEQVIRRRFREYEAESTPVLQFYSPELIHKVDAGVAPLQVLHDAIEAIEEGIQETVVR
jgi:adenylate kinase